jgi:hypothetical protein
MSSYLRVKHRELGEAELLRTSQDGQLWEVRFLKTGSLRTLSSAEFEPLPRAKPHDGFQARRAIESLRMGIVPVDHIEDLTIGLMEERKRLDEAFRRTREYGGTTIALSANYGSGKTHFIALTEQIALREGFLVASLSLDANELKPSDAAKIYQTALSRLRYPNQSERGLAPLLAQARQQPQVTQALLDQSPRGETCPLASSIRLYLDDDVDQNGVVQYLLCKGSLKRAPRLFTRQNVARQYAYLFSGISALARALGYSGLALLIDEVDYYSRLQAASRERAKILFKALICASQGEYGTSVTDDSIPDRGENIYPLRFGDQTSFFFMFATLDSDDQLPVREWLSPALLISLEKRFKAHEIEHFLAIVGHYHAQAFQHNLKVAPEVLRAIANPLERALRSGQLEVRVLSQIAVWFYDLLYVYPHYSPEQRARDLAEALRMAH